MSSALLDQLAEHWRAQGAPIAEGLRPGLSDPEMDALVAPLGLRLPHEARVWWGWHDAAESTTLSHALGNGIVPLPLEAAVANTEMNRAVAKDLSNDPIAGSPPQDYWSPSWLTLAVAAGFGELVCDCGTGTELSPMFLSNFEYPDESQIPVAPSLGTLVSWWVEALDAGAWEYDPARRLWSTEPDLAPNVPERARLLVA